MTHRARRARENAGLSIGQAAKLLKMERDELIRIEETTHLECECVEQLADLYGVNVPWLLGDVDRYDYERVDALRCADKLTPEDRDVIAEFVAALPQKARQ
jgi:predicted transcriptional regulator